MREDRHPSFLELDRHHLRGGGRELADPMLREHLRSCSQCADYLAKLEGAARAEPPAWLAELAKPRPVASGFRRENAVRRHRFGTRKRRAVLIALSAAAGLLFVLRSGVIDRRPQVDGSEVVREKGEPAIAVFLKRGERVWQWDEKSSVRAGDRLRLKILAAGYEHVAVAAPTGEAKRLRLLYGGRLERSETLLPTSWEIDAQPGTEVLHVFLSRRPILEEELSRPTEKSATGPAGEGPVWQKVLRLPKPEREDHAP